MYCQIWNLVDKSLQLPGEEGVVCVFGISWNNTIHILAGRSTFGVIERARPSFILLFLPDINHLLILRCPCSRPIKIPRCAGLSYVRRTALFLPDGNYPLIALSHFWAYFFCQLKTCWAKPCFVHLNALYGSSASLQALARDAWYTSSAWLSGLAPPV